ncbi:MAG: TlpA family protein disulfide reductase [Acidobacteria bacterium]|nr:TlpA family protein disulfide reductase [Acidobacteriota bacterium]
MRVFTVPDLDGAAVDVASVLRGKVGVIAMWASWCEPCLAEIPKLRDLSRAYRDRGLAVLGVGVQQGEETPAKQRRMAAKQLVNYMLLFDEQREFQRAYDLRSLPFTILIGSDGKVRWLGSVLPPDFEARIQTLLKEGPGGGHGG